MIATRVNSINYYNFFPRPEDNVGVNRFSYRIEQRLQITTRTI